MTLGDSEFQENRRQINFPLKNSKNIFQTSITQTQRADQSVSINELKTCNELANSNKSSIEKSTPSRRARRRKHRSRGRKKNTLPINQLIDTRQTSLKTNHQVNLSAKRNTSASLNVAGRKREGKEIWASDRRSMFRQRSNAPIGHPSRKRHKRTQGKLIRQTKCLTATTREAPVVHVYCSL